MAKPSSLTGTQRYSMIVNVADPNKAEMRFDNSGAITGVSLTDVNDGQWHHIAGVFDDPADRLKIYVDGVLEATTITAQTPSGSAEPFSIGRVSGAHGQDFDGLIDEVRIYDTPLVECEIRALALVSCGLISHWPAEGDTTDSADGHDYTLENGAGFAAG